MSIQPALLSVNDTALYLGCSRAKVYRLSALCGTTGFPAPVAIGSRRMFRVTDLDRFIAASVITGNPRPLRSTA